jgi:hypothetical protein
MVLGWPRSLWRTELRFPERSRSQKAPPHYCSHRISQVDSNAGLGSCSLSQKPTETMQSKRNSSSDDSAPKRQQLDINDQSQPEAVDSLPQPAVDSQPKDSQAPPPTLAELLAKRPKSLGSVAAGMLKRLKEFFGDLSLLVEVDKLITTNNNLPEPATLPNPLSLSEVKSNQSLNLLARAVCQVLLLGKQFDMSATVNELLAKFAAAGEGLEKLQQEYHADEQYFAQATFPDITGLCVALVERRRHLFDLFVGSPALKIELAFVTPSDLALCQAGIKATLNCLLTIYPPPPPLAERVKQSKPKKQRAVAQPAPTPGQRTRRPPLNLGEVLEVLKARQSAERPPITHELEPYLASLSKSSPDETQGTVVAVAQSPARNRFEHSLIQAAAFVQLQGLRPGTSLSELVDSVNKLLVPGARPLAVRAIRRDQTVLAICLNWPGLAKDFVGLSCSAIRDYCAVLSRPTGAAALQKLGYEAGQVTIAELWAKLSQ